MRVALPLVALLVACQLAEDAVVTPGRMPAPCPGCLVVGDPRADQDGDGYCEDATACADGSAPGDCDDGSATTYPGAPELPDPIDQDCDGTPYDAADLDRDGYSPQAGDCDDLNPADNPGLTRFCCDDDADQDGVCDADDLCPQTPDRHNGDADRDGLGDACDTCPFEENADDQTDGDGDGIGDMCDVCDGYTSLNQGDLDLDGRCDLDPADLCFGLDALGDPDADGRCEPGQMLLSNDGEPPGNTNAFVPDAAWSETSRRYLAVWRTDVGEDGRSDLWGRVLDAEGMPLTAPHDLAQHSEGEAPLLRSAPAVAWMARDDLFLVASAATPDNTTDYQIEVQLVDLNGLPRGPRRSFANSAPSEATRWYAFYPELNYNRARDEVLLAYVGGPELPVAGSALASDEREIFVRRLDPEGRPLHAGPQRVSHLGPDFQTGYFPTTVSVAWSSRADRYLVAYDGVRLLGDRPEVFFSLVDGDGTLLRHTRQLTITGADPDSDESWAREPVVAYSERAGSYLVVWRSSEAANLGNRIMGQVLDEGGDPRGGAFLIGSPNLPTHPEATTTHPTVSYDAHDGTFVVAWFVDVGDATAPTPHHQVFARLVTPTGLLLGPSAVQLSDLDSALPTSSTGGLDLTYNPLLDEQLLLFHSTDRTWGASGPQTGIWGLTWGGTPGVDSDGDGVRDELDLCAGPDDIDGDGRVWCIDGDPRGDCDDQDPTRGPDADSDGTCDEDDPCPLSPTDDGDNDGSCDNVDRCRGQDGTHDRDLDGVCDDLDPCPLSPTDDADSDGLCDDLDPCLGANASGDADSDGVCNDRDVCTGDDTLDADHDGLPDACDPCPVDTDADNDGRCDGGDPCVGLLNTDADADGTCDDLDPCPLSPTDDLDNDGLCDDLDLCFGDNSTSDVDGDGLCDGLDPCFGDNVTLDLDNDGVCGDLDLCLGDATTGDADADGACDDLDPCFGDNATLDLDHDGICTDLDLCIGDNSTLDTDNDGICTDLDPCLNDDARGDADEDGVDDLCDPCPDRANDAIDSDGDGLPDACDRCPDHRGPGQTDLDLDGLCDLDPADQCFGPDPAEDLDGDGLCEVSHLLLSEAGSTGNPHSIAHKPAIAFSPTSQRHLVVWATDIDQVDPAYEEWDLFARVLDAEGVPVSPPVRLTYWNEVSRHHLSDQPDVAWNSQDDTFFVVYRGDRQDTEIRGLRVDPSGNVLGSEVPVSTSGPFVSQHDWYTVGGTATTPAVAYDRIDNTFVVAFQATVDHYAYVLDWDLFTGWIWVAGPIEGIAGRVVSGAGSRLGTADHVIHGGADPQPTDPDVAIDPLRHQHLVVYSSAFENNRRVVAQLIDASGDLLGQATTVSQRAHPMPISDQSATQPAVSFSEQSDAYLVVWRGDERRPGFAHQATEIYGRLLDANAVPLTGPFAISAASTPLGPNGMSAPDVTWDPERDRFTVAWIAAPATGGLARDEREVFRQVVSPQGELLLPSAERLTVIGVDGSASDGAMGDLALAHNGLLGEASVVFNAHDQAWGGAPGEQGVFTLTPDRYATVDSDLDGVRDELDLCVGPDDLDGDGRIGCVSGDPLGDCDDTDPALGADHDADGGCDDDDPCPYDPDDDADHDGLCADVDPCLGGPSLANPDADGDALCDEVDPCPLTPLNDGDGDGVCDDADLCVGDNTTTDSDADGVCGDFDLCFGDDHTLDLDADGVCGDRDLCDGDDLSGDRDADGLCDERDPCPGVASPLDLDGDGSCEPVASCPAWPGAVLNDADHDGIADQCDNCPLLSRITDQTDSDGDGLGDACDPCDGLDHLRQGDHDLDGACDLFAIDLCAGPDEVGDADGDGLCDVPHRLISSAASPHDPTAEASAAVVALSTTSRHYLAVWLSNTDVDGPSRDVNEVWGRLLDLDGVPISAPVRLSHWGGSAPGNHLAQPSIAWNADDDTWLLAYEAGIAGAFDLYTRLLDRDGLPLQPPQRLTDLGRYGNPNWDAGAAQVLYNDVAREFLVVFRATASLFGNNGGQEVFARRVDRRGQPVGDAAMRVTRIGEGSEGTRDVKQPAAVWARPHNQILIVYEANLDGPNIQDIYASLIDADGAVVRSTFPVSRMGTSDTSSLYIGRFPAVAYSEASDVFFVVWEGDHDGLGGLDGKFEVFGRLLNGDGVPAGDQFRISFTGNLTRDEKDAGPPTVTWDAATDTFVVMWVADPGTQGMHASDREVFAQRVAPTGSLLLPTEERVSFVGRDGYSEHPVKDPSVLLEPRLHQALVLFHADDDPWEQGTYEYGVGVGVWSTIWGGSTPVDSDGDGVRDELDLCAGPDDLDGDGRVGCLTSHPLGDCDDQDPAVASDADADGLCDRDDPCMGDHTTGDADLDGTCDDLDLCLGHDAFDTDRDGTPDGCDPCPYDAGDDADGDGRCADLDLCRGEDLTGDPDDDGVCTDLDPCPIDPHDDVDDDGICDVADQCLGDDASGDPDADGLCTNLDPCPDDALDDSDDDGSCDSLDRCIGDDVTGDGDLDGTCDDLDPCVGDHTTGDTDFDGTCDDLDPCPDDALDDQDLDGVCDSLDLCLGDNTTGDADLDGTCDDLDPCLGDAAAGDADLDGTCDDLDLCLGSDATGDADQDDTCDDLDPCFGYQITGDTDGDGTCDDLDVCAGDDTAGDTDGDGTCNPTLELLDPFVPGTTVRFRLRSALRGSRALLLASTSTTPGARACHPAAPDACTRLTNRLVLGTVIVDATGEARWQVRLPATLPSAQTVALQGLWFESLSAHGDNSQVLIATTP
jgi:hypothetical protein